MKQGTHYAGKIKQVFANLRRSSTEPQLPETDDPLRRFAVAVLGESLGEARSEEWINRILKRHVDWNEIRVSTPHELMQAAGLSNSDYLPAFQRLLRALGAVYTAENRMSLDRIRSMGLRDARQFLEKLSAAGPFVAASVTLWSLGGHGIPVDDRLLDILRGDELVHPQADRSEVQAFLERNIPAADARVFTLLMRDFTGQQHAGRGGAASAEDEAAKTTTRPATQSRGRTKRAAS